MSVLTEPSGESLFLPVDARWLQNSGINRIYIPTDDPPRECPEPPSEHPSDVHYLCEGCADTDSVVVTLNWADDTYQIGTPDNLPGGDPQSGIAAYLATLAFFHVEPRFSGKPTSEKAKKQEIIMGTPPDRPGDPPKEEDPDKKIRRLRKKYNRRKNQRIRRYNVP